MPRLISDRPILTMTSDLARVMAAARAREARGERVFHLERGEPDFDTPAHVTDALAAAARAGETHYPDARGTLGTFFYWATDLSSFEEGNSEMLGLLKRFGGGNHPPVDGVESLGPVRNAIAVGSLVLFGLLFMRTPFTVQ